MPHHPIHTLATCIVTGLACLILISPLTADPMDEQAGDPPGTHQQHVDETIALMNNDADANAVIDELFAYVDYYLDIGYGHVGGYDRHFKAITEPPGIFAEAYQAWLARQLAMINDLLRHCEPRGYELASGYIDFKDVGYGPVITKSEDELLAESEEFGEAYQAWRIRDAIRRALRGDDEAEPVEATGDWESLLATLRHGDHAEQAEAAAVLGALDTNQIKSTRLLALLEDEESLVRFWATSMLLKDPQHAASAEDHFVTGLEDESWPVRHLCAEALNQINSRAARAEIAEILAEETNPTQKWPSKEELSKGSKE